MANYDDIHRIISDYYDEIANDTTKDRWYNVSKGINSDCAPNTVAGSVSNTSIVTSQNGSIRGYNIAAGFANSTAQYDNSYLVDSTSYHPWEATGGGGYSHGGGAGRQDRGGGEANRGSNYVYIPATVENDGEGNYSFVSGAKDALGNIVKAVGATFGSAWAGVSALGKFGINVSKKVFEDVSESAGDFFENILKSDSQNYLNDYNNIFNIDEHGRIMINGLYVIGNNGTVTMYLPDDALAYMYRTFKNAGLMETPNTGVIEGVINGETKRVAFAMNAGYLGVSRASKVLDFPGMGVGTYNPSFGYSFFAISKTSGPHTYRVVPVSYVGPDKLVTLNYSSWGTYYYCGPYAASEVYAPIIPNTTVTEVITILMNGEAKMDTTQEGIHDNSTSVKFDPTVITDNTISGIIQQMNTSYNTEMGSPIYITVINNDCSETTISYHPVTIPISIGVGDIYPVTGSDDDSIISSSNNPSYNPQSNPGINKTYNLNPTITSVDIHDLIPSLDLDGNLNLNLPDINFDNLLDHLFDIIAEQLQGAPGGVGRSLDPNINITINQYYEQLDPQSEPGIPPVNPNAPTVTNPSMPDVTTPNPSLPDPTIPVIIPPIGIGESPVPPPPDGHESAMWTVYNPTQGEVNAFGAWLWNPDFVDTIKRLFESPIDAVFTLHKVFVSPITGGGVPIVVGSIQSPVSAAVVTNQYKTLDCGEIDVVEKFGNIFDYAPHTIIQAYLPFIGIVELDPAYVQRSTVSITYKVDVYTGACVAEIFCKRDGNTVCVYEFSGSCSVEYPVSYHSYSSIAAGVLSGAISAAAGGLGSYISGNPMTAVYGAISGINSAMSGKSEIRHSGSFAGSHGAMGIRKPYLIISRPIPALATDFPYFDGYPANQTVLIGSCTGYIRCKEVHINIPNAYEDERIEVISMLKEGIIL